MQKIKKSIIEEFKDLPPEQRQKILKPWVGYVKNNIFNEEMTKSIRFAEKLKEYISEGDYKRLLSKPPNERSGIMLDTIEKLEKDSPHKVLNYLHLQRALINEMVFGFSECIMNPDRQVSLKAQAIEIPDLETLKGTPLSQLPDSFKAQDLIDLVNQSNRGIELLCPLTFEDFVFRFDPIKKHVYVIVRGDILKNTYLDMKLANKNTGNPNRTAELAHYLIGKYPYVSIKDLDDFCETNQRNKRVHNLNKTLREFFDIQDTAINLVGNSTIYKIKPRFESWGPIKKMTK